MFPRVQGLGQVLAILSKIKPEDISAVLLAVQTIGDQSKELKDRVLAGLTLADIVTDYTETTADDMAVDFLKDAAKTEALWTLVGLVQDLLDGADPKTLEDRQVGELIYTGRGGEAKAVPWVVIVQVALMIFEFLQSRK